MMAIAERMVVTASLSNDGPGQMNITNIRRMLKTLENAKKFAMVISFHSLFCIFSIMFSSILAFFETI
jgi:hypothetical protein